MPLMPLAQFIPRALADQTVEETIRDAMLGRRAIRTMNRPLGPVRGLNPDVISKPPGHRYLGVEVPGNYGVGGQTQMGEPTTSPMGDGGLGLLGELMRSQTQAPRREIAGGPGGFFDQESANRAGTPFIGNSWIAGPEQQPTGGPMDLQHQDDPGLPPELAPGIQPDQMPPSVGPAQPVGPQQQPTAQDFMQPQRQPSSQDFGVQPYQQQPQQGGLSDAGMWGLLAAGLGILANNSGHYGNWQPAVGKGGLIGVNTYLNQRQQGIENVRRDELAKAESARWAQQAEYNKFLIEQGRGKASREQKAIERREEILKKYPPANETEALLLEFAPEKYGEFKAKAAEGYTLPEAAQRFGPDNKLVASNPKDPKTPEGMRLRPDGTYEWDKEYLKGKKEIASSGASKIDIKQGEAFTKPISESVDTSFKQAQSSIQAQGTLNRLAKNLEDPNLIAGVGANKRMTLAQVKQFFGGGSDQGLAVTRSTIQGLAELTLNSRGMLTGQGQITEKEQALLERARGGDIEMSVPELKELVSVLGRMQRAQYDAHQQTLKRLEEVPGGEQAGKFFVPPPFPEPYVPGSGKKDPWK